MMNNPATLIAERLSRATAAIRNSSEPVNTTAVDIGKSNVLYGRGSVGSRRRRQIQLRRPKYVVNTAAGPRAINDRILVSLGSKANAVKDDGLPIRH